MTTQATLRRGATGERQADSIPSGNRLIPQTPARKVGVSRSGATVRRATVE
jgi:hypothetical protein